MEEVILVPGTFLVKRLPEFFKKGVSTFQEQAIKVYDVAEIVSAEEKNKEGLIIYYHSNLGERVTIKGKGEFEVIRIEAVIIYLKNEENV